MARKMRGPIVPLVAYERLSYECIRCVVVFDSKTGPQPFCEPCRSFMDQVKRDLPAPRANGGSK